MKIIELVNNVNIQITNEELDVLGLFYNTPKIAKNDLNAREQIIANNLVNKDILKRIKHEGKIIYKKTVKGT